jgi:hypothetical protein
MNADSRGYIHGTDGRFAGHVGTVSDETRRLAAEAAAKASNDNGFDADNEPISPRSALYADIDRVTATTTDPVLVWNVDQETFAHTSPDGTITLLGCGADHWISQTCETPDGIGFVDEHGVTWTSSEWTDRDAARFGAEQSLLDAGWMPSPADGGWVR